MRKKLLAILLLSFLSFNSNIPAKAEVAEYNPRASADYDPNLNENDLAIAVDKSMTLKEVKIYQKKDGLYLVGATDLTEWEIKNRRNSLRWFKANSIYPYFNLKEFHNKAGKYKKYVSPYLLCVAKKYKFKLEIVTGSTKWPTYYIKDKAEFEDQKKNLEELKTVLEGFEHLPNTFLSYESNPALWNLVAKNSDEYLKCLSEVKNPEKSRIVDFYLKEISKSQKAAENFKGGTDGLYNSGSYLWMYRAVSVKARKEYYATQTGWNTDQDAVNNMNKALDELKEACASKISLLKMDLSLFKYRDASLEGMMKNYLKNASSLKIHKIGLSDSNWIIAKNDIGIPLYRYKRGQMWVRNNSDDHQYCKGLFFEIRQDYSGGGTYAPASVHGYNEELYGCP